MPFLLLSVGSLVANLTILIHYSNKRSSEITKKWPKGHDDDDEEEMWY